LNSIIGCNIVNNIITEGEAGIFLKSSLNNTFSGNTIEDNNQYGLNFYNSDNNIILDNIIQNNGGNGIYLATGSSVNEISQNTISVNNGYGIRIISSNNNIMYLNILSDNAAGNALDPSTNTWYNSTLKKGNTWDDYPGEDADNNGIGDTPYDIPGGAGNQDLYPLGIFQTENQKPIATINSPPPSTITYGKTVYLNGFGEDPDPEDYITAYNWRSSKDGQISTKNSDSISSLSIGTHTLYFKVMDNHGKWSSEKTVQIIVNPIQSTNQKPTAAIITIDPTEATYGNPVYFYGIGTDPDPSDTLLYYWYSSIDGFLDGKQTFTKSDLSVGTHTITFKVQDNNHAWSNEDTKTLTIHPETSTNNPPIANAGGPYAGYVNVTVTFNGSKSYDSDQDDNISYHWIFGDGSNGNGETVDHIYNSTGIYTVELTVEDSHGIKSQDTTYVNISMSSVAKEADDKLVIPGFEIIFIIIAIGIILFSKKYKKRF
jgi:parallel beta-helix repeat protein